MAVSCPDCGSRYINLARFRSLSERLRALSGTRPLRCTDCKTRFTGKTVSLHDLRFAKCPRCYRMDLNVWYQEHFRAPVWMLLKIALGGRRLRCEYCRVNFVSVRLRKEHFSFNRWTRQQAERERNGR